MDKPPTITAPPPVPSDPAKRRNWEQAAMFSLAAPFAGMAISVFGQGVTHGDRLAASILGCTSMFLILAGLVLGILALVKTKRYGKKGIFGRALGGTLINGGLIVIMLLLLPGLMKAMQRAKEQQRQEQQRP